MSAIHSYSRPFSVQPQTADGLPWQDYEPREAEFVERHDNDTRFFIRASFFARGDCCTPARVLVYLCGRPVCSCPVDINMDMRAGAQINLEVPFTINDK